MSLIDDIGVKSQLHSLTHNWSEARNPVFLIRSGLKSPLHSAYLRFKPRIMFAELLTTPSIDWLPVLLNRYLPYSLQIIFYIHLISFPIVAFSGSAAFCMGNEGKNNDKSSSPATQRPYIINNHTFYPLPSSRGYVEKGIASWYGSNFHGRQTSNGEIYNMHGQTAAHKILPMHTMVLVANLENGRKTVVRINDRGPFVSGRIIDLSHHAAREIGMLAKGTAHVQVTALIEGEPTIENIKKRNIPNFNRGDFFVQIGSFISKTNALRLQKNFNNAGHKVIIQKYITPEKLFYRVQVWVGNDLRFARQARQELIKKGYKQAFVIAR